MWFWGGESERIKKLEIFLRKDDKLMVIDRVFILWGEKSDGRFESLLNWLSMVYSIFFR